MTKFCSRHKLNYEMTLREKWILAECIEEIDGLEKLDTEKLDF